MTPEAIQVSDRSAESRMSLGARLKSLRVRKGESLQDVADAISASKAHVWELEKGRSSNPSLDLLERLADHFGVTVGFLIGEGEADSPDKEQVLLFGREFGGKLSEQDWDVLRKLAEHLALQGARHRRGSMTPTIGRIVHYKLTKRDAVEINRRRTTPVSIKERQHVLAWPAGAQAHIGNEVGEGETVAMVIVNVFESGLINGKCLLDGTDDLWVTSVEEGDENGEWSWPPRV